MVCPNCCQSDEDPCPLCGYTEQPDEESYVNLEEFGEDDY